MRKEFINFNDFMTLAQKAQYARLHRFKDKNLTQEEQDLLLTDQYLVGFWISELKFLNDRKTKDLKNIINYTKMSEFDTLKDSLTNNGYYIPYISIENFIYLAEENEPITHQYYEKIFNCEVIETVQSRKISIKELYNALRKKYEDSDQP